MAAYESALWQRISELETVLSIQDYRISVRLREAMDVYRLRTGTRLTYASLAELTGIAEATLQSLAARPDYNTRLSTIARLCAALGCVPGDLLELSTGGDIED
jgi:DNA-binding Xre family transcriptional regulator